MPSKSAKDVPGGEQSWSGFEITPEKHQKLEARDHHLRGKKSLLRNAIFKTHKKFLKNNTSNISVPPPNLRNKILQQS